MRNGSIAALAKAIAEGDGGVAAEAWVAALAEPRAREVARRVLRLDAPLVKQSVASLGSCLIARAMGEPATAELVRRWTEEMEGRGEPWVQAIRAVPLPSGLVEHRTLRELPPGSEQTERLQLAAGATLEMGRTTAPKYPHLAGKGPHPERMTWRWVQEEAAEKRRPAWIEGAQIVSDGWGPVSLVRSPGAAAIALPCPDGGSARGELSDDGALILVYGSHDEYAGGFAMLLDAETLQVRRSIDTPRPVSGICLCDREDRILLCTYGGMMMWGGAWVRALAVGGDDGQLSPDGQYLAVGDGDVKVWSVDEVLNEAEPADEAGFSTTFDPTGERVVVNRTLYHGRTGEVIAQLRPTISSYLEGGPARPWVHCGERFLINMQSGLQMWSMATGEELGRRRQEDDEAGGQDEDEDEDEESAELEEEDFAEEPEYAEDVESDAKSHFGMHFPQWYVVAYDSGGETLAVLKSGGQSVYLHSLPPSGGVAPDYGFTIKGSAVALSPDGTRVAVASASALQIVNRQDELLRHCEWAGDEREQESRGSREDVKLRFSRDGERVACAVGEEGWRVYAVAEGGRDEQLAAGATLTSLPDFAAPWAKDWVVSGGAYSVFTHLPTGAQIAFPAPSAWRVHPAEPLILANDEAHVALRGG